MPSLAEAKGKRERRLAGSTVLYELELAARVCKLIYAATALTLRGGFVRRGFAVCQFTCHRPLVDGSTGFAAAQTTVFPSEMIMMIFLRAITCSCYEMRP